MRLHALQMREAMALDGDPFFDLEWFDSVGMSIGMNMIGVEGNALLLMNVGCVFSHSDSSKMCNGVPSLCCNAATHLGVDRSMFNHSCTPNCQVSIVPGAYRITATSDIKQGAEVCYSYVHLQQPVASRHRELARSFLFSCPCSSLPPPSLPLSPRAEACSFCGAAAAGLRLCSRCRGAAYCGAPCQKAAWGAHKRACKAASKKPAAA